MAEIVDEQLEPSSEQEIARRELPRAHLWSRLALGAVLLLSIFMNFFQLGQNGYGNLYYAAGVRSMTDNWQNFFFVAFDPGSFVTIDKPPLGFWLQALSSKVFGFTPFSIFFPQALCGVLAVLLLYWLVRRHFGIVAGLLAALALAVSPISVVTNRNNTIDGTLALALLLAAWAVIHAAETGKLRWLLLSGVFVGLGFNIKMAEAYLVLPALLMTYLLCAPRKLWTRIWHLALFALVLLAISASWALAVDLTPVAQRPYVGSTQINSELNLAFGYNGLNRLHIGNNGGFGRNGFQPAGADRQRGTTNPDTAARSGQSANGQGAGGTGGNANSGNTANRGQGFPAAGGAFGGGSDTPGIFHLFSLTLGGQIAWLLPFALLAILALAWQSRFNLQRFQQDKQQLGLVLWGFWLVTMATFFTLNGSFHEYYMTEMAPGLSALVGIGLVIMWQDYRRAGWRGWLLPAALMVTAGAQIYLLTSYPDWAQWMSPLIGGLTVLAVLALVLLRLKPGLSIRWPQFRSAGVAVSTAMLVLLLAPTVWAGYSVFRNTESSAPTAGPSPRAENAGRNGTRAGGFPGFAGFGGAFDQATQGDTALIDYLQAHQGNAKYLVATPNASAAEPIILATNKPVMALGGFSGGDPILTTSDLQNMIKNGTVRFFLLSAQQQPTQAQINQLPAQYREIITNGGNNNSGFGGFGRGNSNALSSWVNTNCSVVPASDWQQATQRAGANTDNNHLYDCATLTH